MTDCKEAIRPVHNRTPVLLHVDKHDARLRGDFDPTLGFQQRRFPDGLIGRDPTSEQWSGR